MSGWCNETDVSGCQGWWSDIRKRLCNAWLKGGSLTKAQRLSASASSFRSPERCDKSSSMLSVNEGIRNGNLKPGELRLKIYRIAIWARVSKDAIHFCISLVIGMFSAAKSLNVNFSLNQMTAPDGKEIKPPIWQILVEAMASAAQRPDQSCLGRRHVTNERIVANPHKVLGLDESQRLMICELRKDREFAAKSCVQINKFDVNPLCKWQLDVELPAMCC